MSSFMRVPDFEVFAAGHWWPLVPGVAGSFRDRIGSLLLFEHYNTRVVVFGALLLGLASGMVGCFTLLRRRALVGDALSHATLPGLVWHFCWVRWRVMTEAIVWCCWRVRLPAG